MKKITFILCIVLFLLIGCKENNSNYETSDIFNTSLIHKAWMDKDSLYIKKYIWFLENPFLSDKDFFELVVELSTATGFCFGNHDISNSYWNCLSLRQKDLAKKNTIEVYKLYTKSNLFMVSTTWEITLKFQDWYYQNYKYDSILIENKSELIIEQINHLQ